MKRRIIAAKSKDTHEMKEYLGVYRKYYAQMIGEPDRNIFDRFEKVNGHREITIDPFARDCLWGFPHTNDINPETAAVHHYDALEFLDTYPPHQFKIGLLDPPFSDRMSKDKYGTANLYAADSKKMRQIELELGNKIETGGIIIKLGYNSSKPHPGFILEDFEIWNLGACRNDIICTIWRKVNSSIMEWV